MERNRHLLLETLNVSGSFLGALYEKQGIDQVKKDEFLQPTKAKKCRRKFIDWLLKGNKLSRNVWEAFLFALTESDQDALRRKLEGFPEEANVESPEEQMDCQIRLRKCQSKLIDRLSTPSCMFDLLTLFQREKILSEEDRELVECQAMESNKTAKLLSILHYRPPKAFRLLIKCLKEDLLCEDLAEQILGTTITEEDRTNHYGSIYFVFLTTVNG